MTDKLPVVSIVIPVYNGAEYLDEAVQSILAQDYPSIELIVLDDGSTDGTREVLGKYTGRFYWETHENIGQASTLNKGWLMSKGEILAYLSADDILLSGAVSRSVENLRMNPESVLVYCDFNLIDPSSMVLRQVRMPNYDYRKMVTRTIRPPGPGAFFTRKAFESAGLWDSSLKQSPDYEYWLRLGLEGPFLRIPRVLASLRVHEASQSFAKVDESGAGEPVRVTSRYYRTQRVPPEIRRCENEALSNAHVMAARMHLRAGRWRAALGSLRKALVLHPKNLYSLRTIRVIANGLFNRMGHRMRWLFGEVGKSR